MYRAQNHLDSLAPAFSVHSCVFVSSFFQLTFFPPQFLHWLPFLIIFIFYSVIQACSLYSSPFCNMLVTSTISHGFISQKTLMFINSVKTSNHAAEHMFYTLLVNCDR
jgi:hypothetical protein